MSEKDPFSYRVKFMDMRVKPPKEETSRARAKATKVCSHKDCDLEGTFPAPKRNGKGKHHFCEAHIKEYNRSFNFFDGMSEAEAAAFSRAERFGHKRTWKMGTGPAGTKDLPRSHDPAKWAGHGFFNMDETAAGEAAANKSRSTLQTRALKELDLPADAPTDDIRARYAEYVRQFHPDSNQGDRSSEEKLQRVLRAGKVLKAAGLLKR